MLGQPVSMLIPRVVGFKLTGEIQPGVTATDVVLTVTEMLRKHGVVGKFVEFYGEGVAEVPLANRATLGNMSPEFGSTAAIFPIDQDTIDYLRFTGRKRRAAGAGRGLRQRAGHVARPQARAGVLRVPRARPFRCGAVDRRAQASAGPNRVVGCQVHFPQGRFPATSATTPDKQDYSKLDEAVDETFPASDPGARVHRPRRRRRRCAVGRQHCQGPAEQPGEGEVRGARRIRARPRRGGDRRDHVVHQHLQPGGDARRGAAGPQRRRKGTGLQAVGEDHDGAGLPGGQRLLRTRPACGPTWRSSASTWSATAAPPASATPARCPTRSRRPSTTTTFRWPRCCRATATSRAASTPT